MALIEGLWDAEYLLIGLGQLRDCGCVAGNGACCEYPIRIHEHGWCSAVGSRYGERECDEGGDGAGLEGAG